MRASSVGLNLLFLVPGQTGGMEVAARQLIPALLDAAPPQMRFMALINRETAAAKDGPWGELLPAITVPVNARSRMQWVLGEQTLAPWMARRAGIELLHSLGSTAPAWGRFGRVVTIHDLIYARFPEAHGGLRGLGMRMLVPLAARRSDRIVAISQSTRADLEELLGIAAQKIDVIPQGLSPKPDRPPVSPGQARERFSLGERQIVLSLSAKRPHKNLAVLIAALASLPADRRPLLLLPGYPTWHEAELRDTAQQLGVQDDVRFLGWVSGEDLEALWAVADAFLYPSLYEGFGLPVLEAMAREVPVACSNASSLPEVVGDAALLFDSGSNEQIAAAIERLLGDPQLAGKLRQAGLRQAARFTWQRTAELTIATYERVLGARGRQASQ